MHEQIGKHIESKLKLKVKNALVNVIHCSTICERTRSSWTNTFLKADVWFMIKPAKKSMICYNVCSVCKNMHGWFEELHLVNYTTRRLSCEQASVKIFKSHILGDSWEKVFEMTMLEWMITSVRRYICERERLRHARVLARAETAPRVAASTFAENRIDSVTPWTHASITRASGRTGQDARRGEIETSSTALTMWRQSGHVCDGPVRYM